VPAAVRRVSLPGWGAILATAIFIGVTLWWLLNDGRIPIWDSGAHQFTALEYRDGFGNGHPWLWFTANNPPTYPPLVHLVGALATVFGGISTTAMVLGQNLFFVPALVGGCFLAGTALYDRRVGALAAVVALGSPILVDGFHLFMLDSPQAAMTALAVGSVLASKRFSHDWISFAAGLAAGAAMMTKNTSVLFLAGLLGLLVLRGGWRNPRGMALYLLGALVVGGAWYVVHLRDQLKFAGGAAVAGSSELSYDPPALSWADLTWYVWDAANYLLYLPLCLFVGVGACFAIARVLPRPQREDQMPEFLVGCFIGWFTTDLLANNDDRYLMPAIVYLAVIGTGWLTQIRPRWPRRALMGVVVAIAAVNFVTVSFGIGPTWHIDFSDKGGSTENGVDRVTFLRPNGYLVGGPEAAGRVVDVLKQAHAEGVRQVALDRNATNAASLNVSGLSVALREAGLRYTPSAEYTALGPKDIYIDLAPHGSIDAEPCAVVPDGDVYFERGPNVLPLDQATNLWCPSDPDRVYAAAGAASHQPSAQDRELRASMQDMLDAAGDKGLKHVFFEDSVASLPYYGGAQALYAQAAKAGLQPPTDGLLSNLSADDGLYVYVSGTGKVYPKPCLTLPNPDQEIVAFKGTDKQTPIYADNLYCPTFDPPEYKAPLAAPSSG
jgi:branched-subunit amino acid transport protein